MCVFRELPSKLRKCSEYDVLKFVPLRLRHRLRCTNSELVKIDEIECHFAHCSFFKVLQSQAWYFAYGSRGIRMYFHNLLSHGCIIRRYDPLQPQLRAQSAFEGMKRITARTATMIWIYVLFWFVIQDLLKNATYWAIKRYKVEQYLILSS